MVGVSGLASLALFLISLNPAVQLHPRAYPDLVRSIVGVYLVFFISALALEEVLSRFYQEDEDQEGFPLVEVLKGLTPYDSLCLAFTLVTLVNSLMMITGVDVPKEGVFAYVHLMMRLGIIALVVGLLSTRELLEAVKRGRRTAFSTRRFLYGPHKNGLVGVARAFTHLVVAICILMIAFQEAISPLGGWLLYLSLLFMFFFLLLIRVLTLGLWQRS